MSTPSYSQSRTQSSSAETYEEEDNSDDTKQTHKLDVHKLHRHDIVRNLRICCIVHCVYKHI